MGGIYYRLDASTFAGSALTASRTAGGKIGGGWSEQELVAAGGAKVRVDLERPRP
jgi:hypothetical protein